MSDHEFTIRTLDFDASGKSYRFVVPSRWIRGELEGCEATATARDGELALRASKSGHDVVVHGTLDASLSVPCARCLEHLDIDVHAEISVIYVPGDRVKAPDASGEVEYTLEDAEADTLPYDGETVVLDGLVRDELLLGVPMIPLCSADCPGMSPGPQIDAEAPAEKTGIDPRLAPLMAFREKTRK